MKSISEFKLKKVPTEFEKAIIRTSKNSADYIRKFFFEDIGIFESFFTLLLSRSNTTIGYSKISQGGIAGTVVDVKLIAKYAIDALASSVILCHNHPSGNLQPSKQDIDLTKKVISGLKLLDIQVLDHVILTETEHYSFADSGLLIY